MKTLFVIATWLLAGIIVPVIAEQDGQNTSTSQATNAATINSVVSQLNTLTANYSAASYMGQSQSAQFSTILSQITPSVLAADTAGRIASAVGAALTAIDVNYSNDTASTNILLAGPSNLTSAWNDLINQIFLSATTNQNDSLVQIIAANDVSVLTSATVNAALLAAAVANNDPTALSAMLNNVSTNLLTAAITQALIAASSLQNTTAVIWIFSNVPQNILRPLMPATIIGVIIINCCSKYMINHVVGE